jgi:hypothetical protein
MNTQLCDCVANAQAVACARYAIFQHLVVNLPEQIDVEIVGLESIGNFVRSIASSHLRTSLISQATQSSASASSDRLSFVVSTAVIASLTRRQASSNCPSSAQAVAKYDRYNGSHNVVRVDRNAVIRR